MYFSAGFSEDSDYTSDFNFPVNGQIPNAATSQYLPVALHARGAASAASASDHPYRGQEDPFEVSFSTTIRFGFAVSVFFGSSRLLATQDLYIGLKVPTLVPIIPMDLCMFLPFMFLL